MRRCGSASAEDIGDSPSDSEQCHTDGDGSDGQPGMSGGVSRGLSQGHGDFIDLLEVVVIFKVVGMHRDASDLLYS